MTNRPKRILLLGVGLCGLALVLALAYGDNRPNGVELVMMGLFLAGILTLLAGLIAYAVGSARRTPK
jgi:succinate-acetate transporter protein